MKKIFDRLTALVMVMLMFIQSCVPAITSFAKEEELDKRYVIQKLETLKQDTYANFSLNLATVIDDKNLDTDTNVKFVLNTTNVNSNIKLLVRKDFSLYDERTFDTVEEAHKEFDRVDKSLKDQGVSLDVSVVQEDGKYRIHNNYVPQADKEDFGDDYKVYSLKVVPEFDFDKEGLFNKLPEDLKSTEQHRLQLAEERRLQQDGEVPEGDKHNRTYIFDFKVDKAVDSKLTTIALNKDDNNPLEVKQSADLFAAILDDKTYSTYQTEQLPAEVTSSIEHKKEVAEAKAQADAKAKAEADAKAKAEAEEKAKKEAEEKAKADAKAKEEADAKAKQEADAKAKEEAEKIKAEEAKKTEEQKALEEKAKAEKDAKAKQEADAKAKAEAEKLKAEAEAKQKAEAEEKAKQEQLAKEQAEAEAKRAAEEKAKKDLENKKLLGLVQGSEEEQEEPIIKKKETTEEIKKEPATPEERKQKAEEFEKALQDKKEDIKKPEDKKDANNKEDNKTTDKKQVSKETKGLLEGIKEFFGLTNLQKADRELKAILSVKANGLKEVQALLASFEAKYHLTQQEQAKLMDDNKDAIKALIEKDADKNFTPQVLMAAMGSDPLTEEEKSNLKNKKFIIRTRFDASVANGNIPTTQSFTIKLDDKLTVNDSSSLKAITDKDGNVIAKPTYSKTANSITYNLVKPITKDLQIPLEIPVDYNVDNIKVDVNGNFTVTNKVSGLGVKAPKDLVPQKIDKNGKPAGSIIEPGRNDVIKIIEPDDSNYRVDTDAYAIPVIKDGKLDGYNWTIKVSSDTDLNELGLKVNFTEVVGSGLGEFQNSNVELDDQLEKAFGIHDSKHHAPKAGIKEITYNFYTPVQGMQEKYMMDISIILTAKNKVGAKRFVMNGWPADKVKEATPIRSGMNNRTTVLGEFKSESEARWTVTDAISTGDDKGTKEKPADTKLPWETRKLSDNQTLQKGQVAVYKIDTTSGKMVQVGQTQQNVNPMPEKGENPNTNQTVGTIAVYGYDTSFNTDEKKPLSLAGVMISKYKDIYVNQNWNLDQGLNMPAQTLKAVDPSDSKNELGSTSVDEETPGAQASRSITIPTVKVWNIQSERKFTKTQPKIVQTFPTDKTYNGKTISYYENHNYYDPNTKGYNIHNRGTVEEVPKRASFTIVKTDKKDPEKKLAGAKFKLLGGPEVITDANGEAVFNNIAPGTYTIFETKAPNGYKSNQENATINIDKEGRVSLEGGPASISAGANPTQTVEHGGYPDYMNAMQYATKDAKGNVTTYIFLKANEEQRGGSTNRDTRLNLRMDNGSVSTVEVFDVDPNYQRKDFKSYMTSQTVESHIEKLGGSVLNYPHTYPINGSDNIYDDFLKKTGYQISLPKERFANDWGFLVKVTGKGDSLTYDWLTNEDTGKQAKLQDQKIVPSTSNDTDKATKITITNEAFETRQVGLTKLDKGNNPVAGATFVIKDENGDVISTVTSDKDGKVSFGDMPGGKYTIEETEAPAGYVKSDVIFEVTVDDSKQLTYIPKFKNGNGYPVNGEDYFIKDIEQGQDDSRAKVTSVTQDLYVNDKENGSIGRRPGIWEAYFLESLSYTAKINLDNSAPGTRFSIQFDPNLDFTQYFSEFPKIMKDGKAIADPYFDYTTNKLTYVFNKNSDGGPTLADIKLVGMIPSKYFAQNDGTYNFTVTVAPGQEGLNNNTITPSIIADYNLYYYDPADSRPSQAYYFRDVYKSDDGNWYVTALAYYNPDYVKPGKKDVLNFNWKSVRHYTAGNYVKWKGDGTKSPYDLTDVKIYRTAPDMGKIDLPELQTDKKVNYNMPLSFGVRPEQDPSTYHLIYSRSINPNEKITNDRNGDVVLNYDPSKLNTWGTVEDKGPLNIQMPSVNNSNKDGYIIEQTFKISDIDKFNNTWRAFNMSNGPFNSAFVSKANANKAIADQTGGEIPKFYSQEVGLFNKKYEPGKFSILKQDETNSKPLAKATFSLTDEDNNVIYRSSGADGIVSFENLKPGSYTLKEEISPTGFVKTDRRWNVNVSIDGNVTITEIGLNASGGTIYGKEIQIPVGNKPTATEFRVYKKDADNKPLEGAEFKLTKQGETNAFATGTSRDGGVVKFNKSLEKGTYILEETKSPDGYQTLDSKWVVEVDANNKVKIYTYNEKKEDDSSGETQQFENSLLTQDGVNWVNVSQRPTDKFISGDNRQTGYADKSITPYKLGTRIVGINKTDKYAIQRYVINPEGKDIDINSALVHREKLWDDNMSWYAGKGKEDVKIYTLDNPVTTNVEDIRLYSYNYTDITDKIDKSSLEYSYSDRLQLVFKKENLTDANGNSLIKGRPIVVDVKIPYTSEYGGVGTGMDLNTSEGPSWKSDYYEQVSDIVVGDPIKKKNITDDIKGSYISDDYLDVTNEKKRYEFSIDKVNQEENASGGHDAVTGATFKLVGPKPSEDTRWTKSDENGKVSFKDLVPGIYKLVEEGAAKGYEKSNIDWQVAVLKDGKIYIREKDPSANTEERTASEDKNSRLIVGNNNISRIMAALRLANIRSFAANTWEVVNPSRSTTAKESYNSANDINKAQEQPYDVNLLTSSDVGDGGTINSSTRTAKAGDTVTVTPQVNPGYILEKFEVLYSSGAKVSYTNNGTSYSFTMPNSDVTVKARFKKQAEVPTKHKIKTQTPSNGKVEVPTSANVGDKVTIKATPNNGYVVDKIVVRGGQVDIPVTNNTFTMPNSDVVVDVTFKAQIKKYTVSFNANNGSGTMNPVEVSENDTYTLPANKFTRPQGQVFKGWNVSGQVKQPGETITIKGNVVITPVWETSTSKPQMVNVPSNIQNGSVSVSPTSAAPGETVTLTVKPAEGYQLNNLTVTRADNNAPIEVNGKSQAGSGDVSLAADSIGDLEISSVSIKRQAASEGSEEIYSFTMPESAVKVSASFTPIPKPEDLLDSFEPEEGKDFLIGDNPEKPVQITNKKDGITPKVIKTDSYGNKLEGAKFIIKKMTDDKYDTEDDKFTPLKGTSDKEGNVTFKDAQGNVVKLKKGYYVMTEEKSPEGYKRIIAPWKIEVRDDGGRMYSVYKGPTDTPSSFIDNDKKANARAYSGTDIKVKSRLTYINPETKTYVQRIYIDTRYYTGSDLLNVQITPKYKREEIDRPGLPPVTIKEGVKTAYRTTYELVNPGDNADIQAEAFDKILRTYDLSNPNMSMVNTARWRPFDWGFDEDQLNIGKGVYIVEVEGYYDDAIINGTATNEVYVDKNFNFTDANGKPSKEPVKKAPYKKTEAQINPADYGKIDLHVDFYRGKREFKQLLDPIQNYFDTVIGETGKNTASYQGGAEAMRKYLEARYGKVRADAWAKEKPAGQKYANYISKKLSLSNGDYITGKIDPAIPTRSYHNADTSVDLNPIYSSKTENEVPKDGLVVENEKEKYNITFSKHGRDNPDDKADSQEVTEKRLEGAVFKIQKLIGGNYEDVKGSTVASAFNGYFGFRNLEPGRYRLMEVQAPKGYRPINEPLLYFTVETIKTDSGKIVDPETGKIIDIKTIKVKFPGDDKGQALTSLYMTDPKDAKKKIKINEVDSKEINMETTIYKSSDATSGKLLKELTLVVSNGREYALLQTKIISDSSGFVSLEYQGANGVYQYVPEKTTSVQDGKLVDFVTSATAKNMGKIINEKPGKGSITINKKDGERNALKGANFKLTRLSRKKTEDETGTDTGTDKKVDGIYNATSDANGKIEFENLPIGDYELVETGSVNGYQNKGQVWHFSIGGEGLDPYSGPIARTGVDLTSQITLKKSDMTIVRPDNDPYKQIPNTIWPNSAQLFRFDNDFEITNGKTIRPGDYFQVKLSDYTDLYGIYNKDLVSGLDIYADGIGTIAKADYDATNGIITYTFTEYARTYELTDFNTSIVGHITHSKFTTSRYNVPVGIKMNGDNTNSTFKNVNVIFDLGTHFAEAYGTRPNISSKITYFDTKTGEFEHIFYLNRDQNLIHDGRFTYLPAKGVENLRMQVFRVNDNLLNHYNRNWQYNMNNILPPSYAVDVNKLVNNGSIYLINNNTYYGDVSRYNSAVYTFPNGYLQPEDTYIIRVTGNIKDKKDTEDYEAQGKIDRYNAYNYHLVGAERHDYVYAQLNRTNAEAKLEITVKNPKNEISFKKTDLEGRVLKGAKFALVKQDGEKWTEVEKSEKTTGEDGLVKYEKLAPGKYALIEKEAPAGYNKIEGHIEEFTVDKEGIITKEVTKPSEETPAENKPVTARIRSAVQGLANNLTGEKTKTETVNEPIGSDPIKVVNYKNIEFVKVDGDDNTKTLQGAVFEIHYKEKEDDKYAALTKKVKENGKEVDKPITVTSEKDGKFKLPISKDGFYALVETKAPEGYSKLPGKIKEFKLEGGSVSVLEKDPLKASLTMGKKGQITSQVLSVDKDKKTFTQRIVINPKHEEITGINNFSYLRILENGWSITPKFIESDGKEGIGGEVKVALLKKEPGKDDKKSIAELEDTDFTTHDAIEYGTVGNNTGSRYSLKELLGKDTDSTTISTTDTIVVEYTGTLADNKTSVDQKAELIIDNTILDTADHGLDINTLSRTDPVYVDVNKSNITPIPVENRKATYPLTGALGIIGFLVVGAVMMTTAYYKYRRKRRESALS
ncbi:SpaA isopeptide-forming pilin-related protein [Finegoldia sp. BIOML-A1]|uniref:SpaA isopeptide-forming pilin-related protein n=1 Tax=Finegoldia sp. BIOML-A1 TaxID=2584649 RepID=UPI0012B0878C|nr:SpaA isopeptide-forming pilin-related protein [Finegoldia sp. BIOML-A1]MSB11277.1 hypothetical protein [Finegoldia sp. BIOML-A1]